VGELDLDRFEAVVGRVPDDEAVIMAGEGGRESSDGCGKEEGGDPVRLGEDGELEVGGGGGLKGRFGRTDISSAPE